MTNAYDILSDARKKQEYDAMRKSGFASADSYSGYYGGTQQNQNSGPYSSYYNDSNAYGSSGSYGSNSSENFEEKIRQRFRRSGFSNTYTKYSYKDPKTGEWKTYTSTQGNPFFKDFEDLFRKASQQQQNQQNKNYYYDNSNYNSNYDQYSYQNQQQQNTYKDDPFRNYWERNKNYDYRFKRKNEQQYYDDYSSHDSNRFNNKTYNPFGSNPGKLL